MRVVMVRLLLVFLRCRVLEFEQGLFDVELFWGFRHIVAASFFLFPIWEFIIIFANGFYRFKKNKGFK